MPRPERGEVWIVDLGYQGKVRPCLVLSVPTGDTDRAMITYVPATTSERGSRFEVPYEAPFMQRPGVFDAQGIATVDHTKLKQRLGQLPAEQFADVEVAVKRWLGFAPLEDASPEEPPRRVIYLDDPAQS